jgi:ABC-type Fe3+ transport system permease subunit
MKFSVFLSVWSLFLVSLLIGTWLAYMVTLGMLHNDLRWYGVLPYLIPPLILAYEIKLLFY